MSRGPWNGAGCPGTVWVKYYIKERGFDKKNRFEDEKLFKEDGWRCKICKKSFNSKEVYEYHMRKHDGNLKCPKCKEEFRNQSGLDLHLKLCREGDDKINIEKHECDKCGKKFGSESQLKFHMGKWFESIILIRLFCDVDNFMVTFGMLVSYFVSNFRRQHR